MVVVKGSTAATGAAAHAHQTRKRERAGPIALIVFLSVPGRRTVLYSRNCLIPSKILDYPHRFATLLPRVLTPSAPPSRRRGIRCSTLSEKSRHVSSPVASCPAGGRTRLHTRDGPRGHTACHSVRRVDRDVRYIRDQS